MRHRFRYLVLAALAAVALTFCLTLGACRQPTAVSVVFEPSRAIHDTESVRGLLADTDTSAVSKSTVVEAAKLRHVALVELRSKGAAAEEAATLITRTFPADTRAVPVRVQTAGWTAGGLGKSVVVLVEAYGPASGHLTQKRLWVLERATGAVLFAASER